VAAGDRINPYWLAPSVAIGVPLVLGPLGAWLGVLRPDTGLFLVGMAVFVAFASTAGLAAASAYASATARPWRSSALRAALVPLVVVLAVMAFSASQDAPPLNDVSTDLTDRPGFRSAAALPADEIAAAERDRLEHASALQRQAYPHLVPVLLDESPAAAFERALAAARAMPRWEVVRADPRALEIEALATSRIFRFVDDVAIRVRPDAAGARIDIRSRSRIGSTDAALIRDFTRTLRTTSDQAQPQAKPSPGDPATESAQ
jgi:uncharacterized protein (DUF1499 family)